MSGFTTRLLTGLASAIQTAGLGTYNTSGAYTALQTGIVLGNIPQSPDRVITLTAYGASDDPSLSDSTISVQVRVRWGGADKRPVDDLDDSIFSLLHGVTHLIVGTGGDAVHIVQCLRTSGPAPLGQDENHRWSVSSNYLVTVHRPSAHRI